MKHFIGPALLLALGAAAPSWAQRWESAARTQAALEVRASHFDISPPMRDLPSPPDFGSDDLGPENPSPPATANKRSQGTPPLLRDPLVERALSRSSLRTSASTTPAPTLNVPGLGNTKGDGGYTSTNSPADPVGDVDGTYYLQWVNQAYALFDRSTGVMKSNVLNGNSLWSGFTGNCSSQNAGDPQARFDAAANRWILSQYTGTNSPYTQCIAVSTSADPLGTYYRFAFTWPGGYFNDYGKLGIWPDGYYWGVNQFDQSKSPALFVGAGIAVMDRTKLLAGDATATMQYFNLGLAYESVFPSDWDGAAAMQPPSGAPNVFVTVTSNALFLWKFHTDFATPANTTLTGPATLPVAAFTPACVSTIPATCIAQPGTTTTLDSLSDRPMVRFAYRNFGDHESWVLNHAVKGGGTGDGYSAVRWYELRDLNGTPTVYQQGTQYPDPDTAAVHRWAGSAAMNRYGDIGIGYDVSSGNTTTPIYPSIRYATRAPSDPLGTLGAEQSIQVGSGYQSGVTCVFGICTAAVQRWGDYASTVVDPSNGCTFFHTNQYIATLNAGPGAWNTKFAAFPGPSCAGGCVVPAAPTGLTATASGNNQVSLAWAGAGTGATYAVYRRKGGCGGPPYTQLATGLTSPSYVDTGVMGGDTYGYIVSATESTGKCESYRSACVAVAAYGDCTSSPTFAGLSTVGPSQGGNNCGVSLSWSAATSGCSGGPEVTYNVYRSDAGFTPSASNLIAKCVTGTSYTDTAVTNGSVYEYIVRAEDATSGHGGFCNGGNEDTNAVMRKGVSGVTNTLYSNTFDTGTGRSDWTVDTGPDNGDWRGAIASSPNHSSPNVFHFGGADGGGTYASSAYTAARPNGATGIVIPAASAQSQLSFWHHYDFEAGSDGTYLRISRAGDSSPTVIPTSAYLKGGPNASINYGCAPTGAGGKMAWTGTQSTMTQVQVDLDAACDAIAGNTGGCAGKTIYIDFVAVSDCNTNFAGWYLDDVSVTVTSASGSACSAAPSDVRVFSATSSSTQNKLEWVNPSSGAYGSTVVVYRTDRPPTSPSDGTQVCSQGAAGLGAKDTCLHTGLTNGTTYYYGAFVGSGSPATYSGGKTLTARAQDTTGPVKWVYSTGASALTPPSLKSGAAGTGIVYSPSNDRIFHAMNVGAGAGDWPSTFMPVTLNASAQGRPPIVPVTVGGASRVAFLGTQDGKVYALNADTGAILWTSPVLGTSIQAAPVLSLVQYGGPADLVLVGTRSPGAANKFYALNLQTGAIAWTFDNGGGANGIGIISAAADADATNGRVYFTSRALSGGSSDTVWALNFTGTTVTKAWSRPVGDSDGSAILSGGQLLVGTNASLVYALVPSTGANAWASGSFNCADGPVKGYVLPGRGTASSLLFLATTSTVWALNNTGTLAWSHALGSPSVPLVGGTGATYYLWVGSSDGKLYQYNASSGAALGTPLTLGAGNASVGSPSLNVLDSSLDVGTDLGAVYTVSVPLP